MRGWHDRLKAEARTCLAKQSQNPTRGSPKPAWTTASLASRSTRPCSAKGAWTPF